MTQQAFDMVLMPSRVTTDVHVLDRLRAFSDQVAL